MGGTALMLPQEHPQAGGYPHPTSTSCLRACSGDLLSYPPPTPKPPPDAGFLFQFCFSLLSPPIPRALGTLSPLHTSPYLQFWSCSVVVAGSGRAPADGSFGVSEVPAAPGMGTRFLQGGLSVGGGRALPQGASRGARWLSVLDNLSWHLNTSKSGVPAFSKAAIKAERVPQAPRRPRGASVCVEQRHIHPQTAGDSTPSHPFPTPSHSHKEFLGCFTDTKLMAVTALYRNTAFLKFMSQMEKNTKKITRVCFNCPFSLALSQSAS